MNWNSTYLLLSCCCCWYFFSEYLYIFVCYIVYKIQFHSFLVMCMLFAWKKKFCSQCNVRNIHTLFIKCYAQIQIYRLCIQFAKFLFPRFSWCWWYWYRFWITLFTEEFTPPSTQNIAEANFEKKSLKNLLRVARFFQIYYFLQWIKIWILCDVQAISQIIKLKLPLCVRI